MFEDISKLIAPKEKFRIICIDKFEPPGEGHSVWGDYDSLEEAIAVAKAETLTASKETSSENIATVFYVYDDKGIWRCPK